MIGDRHTRLGHCQGPGAQTGFPGPPSSPCWSQTIGSTPTASLLGWGCAGGCWGSERLGRLPRVLWGISGGVGSSARALPGQRVAPGSCTVHLLPGSPVCSCLAGGQVHSSWTSLDLYRAFQLVKILTAKEQRTDGEKLPVGRVPQVCGRSARAAVSPAEPAPARMWPGGKEPEWERKGEEGERGLPPLPVPLRS